MDGGIKPGCWCTYHAGGKPFGIGLVLEVREAGQAALVRHFGALGSHDDLWEIDYLAGYVDIAAALAALERENPEKAKFLNFNALLAKAEEASRGLEAA